jgi:hypothetical protein
VLRKCVMRKYSSKVEGPQMLTRLQCMEELYQDVRTG